MRVAFIERTGGPELLVCEAELIFDSDDDPEPLRGLKLVGFSLWRGAAGELYMTMPARRFSVGYGGVRYYEFLRAAEPGNGAFYAAHKRFSTFIINEYTRTLALPERNSISGPVDADGRVESVDGVEAQQDASRPQLPTALGKPAEQLPVSHKRPRGRASREKKTGSKSNG